MDISRQGLAETPLSGGVNVMSADARVSRAIEGNLVVEPGATSGGTHNTHRPVRRLVALHLIWAVPLAVVAGFIPVAYARLDRCGFDECLRDPGGFQSPSSPIATIAAIVSAVLLFVAIVAVPWARPVGVRMIVGAIAGLLLGGYWLYYILITGLPVPAN